MGGVASNFVGLRQREIFRGRKEEPGAVVAANSSHKSADFYIKRYFGSGKGEALETQKAWQGSRRQGCRGFRGWGR